MMKKSINNKGFTLIEIIIALVVAAILGTMLFTYSSTSVTQSTYSLTQMSQTADLQKVMENIFLDYKLNFFNDLTGIQGKIGSAAVAQPLSNSYGTYTLLYNNFIKFVGNSETAAEPDDPQDILKVTIRNNLGQTLSILLTM